MQKVFSVFLIIHLTIWKLSSWIANVMVPVFNISIHSLMVFGKDKSLLALKMPGILLYCSCLQFIFNWTLLQSLFLEIEPITIQNTAFRKKQSDCIFMVIGWVVILKFLYKIKYKIKNNLVQRNKDHGLPG